MSELLASVTPPTEAWAGAGLGGRQILVVGASGALGRACALALVRVGHVPQAERHADDLKLGVGKRQMLSVGFDEHHASVAAGFNSLLPTDRQHRVAEVGADDRQFSAKTSVQLPTHV